MTMLAALVDTSRDVGTARGRNDKVARLAQCLRALAPDELRVAVTYLSGDTPQGRTGIGWSALDAALRSPAVQASSLAVVEVDARLAEIASLGGRGSAARREQLLGALFARATQSERDFLARLLLGELRQGALQGVMLEAIAQASGVAATAVRRAAMYASAAEVAQAALTGGPEALAAFSLRTLSPVAPMLAESAEDVDEAIAALGEAALEWKLDGARVQAHKSGDVVRVYTRKLNDVTAAVPEVVAAVAALPAREIVLDGETIALAASGAPLPFQVTMRRFGRKLDIEQSRSELPLSTFFFDCLRLDDSDLVDRPTRERVAALSSVLPAPLQVPRLVTADPAEARAFLDAALARGHEGLMAKDLDAPYESGRRGAAWLKIKRSRTLDLVVLAAEWGHGRRRGRLSNLHLGARDAATGSFVMLGKTFKGLTDPMLAWQTQALLALEIGRDDTTVHVRPELVVEIAFSDLQESPRYPGGLALRFARVKRYRPDKTANEADTFETVQAIRASQAAHGDPL